MAGDWIKMRGNLWDDPRVTRLCDLTDSSEAAIVGALYWLWATADQHSQDGVMPGLTLRAIDRKTGVQGFADALVSIGWLADHPEGVRLVRFEEHNGESAKRRASDAQRKANVRKTSDKTRTDDGQNLDEMRRIAELEKEKRREEIKTPLTPQGGQKSASSISLQTYLDNCKQAGKKPIDEKHAVFEYADKTGIPHDFLRLQWLEFKARYTMPEAKRYKAWQTVFLKSVRGNWFKLWYATDGTYALTTAGQQAKAAHREAP